MLSRSIKYLVFLLLALMLVLEITSVLQENQTIDEGVHLSAGYSYLKTGDFRLNAEHPPLLKELAALPLLFLKPDLPTDHQSWQENDEWWFANRFLYHNRLTADGILFLGRLTTMILSLILGLIVYKWTKKVFGSRAALAALFLFVLEPNFLAHSRYVTTDLGVTLFFILSLYCWGRYLEQASHKNLILAALTFALAQNAKFSAIILWPIFMILFIIKAWHDRIKNMNPKASFENIVSQQATKNSISTFSSADSAFVTEATSAKEAAPSLSRGEGGSKKSSFPLTFKKFFSSFLIILLVFAALTWVLYGFETKTILTDPAGQALYQKRLELLSQGLDDQPTTIKFLVRVSDRATWSGQGLYFLAKNLPIPFYSYFKGLASLAAHNYHGHLAYLMGQYSDLGWWYYFPIAFLVKTPLAILILLSLTLIILVKKSFKRFKGLTNFFKNIPFSYYLFLIPALIYFLWSLTSHINLGFRHLLPIYPFILILISSLFGFRLSEQSGRQKLLSLILILIVFSYSLSSFLIYPHYLAYFNALAGGPPNGPRYLVDSNIDWGQDLKNLKIYLDKNNINEVYLSYFGQASLDYYQIPSRPIPDNLEIKLNGRPKGVVAISVTSLLSEDRPYDWLLAFEPKIKIGYSIYLYDFRN